MGRGHHVTYFLILSLKYLGTGDRRQAQLCKISTSLLEWWKGCCGYEYQTWSISRIIIWSLDNNVAVLSIYFERLEVASELWFCAGVVYKTLHIQQCNYIWKHALEPNSEVPSVHHQHVTWHTLTKTACELWSQLQMLWLISCHFWLQKVTVLRKCSCSGKGFAYIEAWACEGSEECFKHNPADAFSTRWQRWQQCSDAAIYSRLQSVAVWVRLLNLVVVLY